MSCRNFAVIHKAKERKGKQRYEPTRPSSQDLQQVRMCLNGRLAVRLQLRQEPADVDHGHGHLLLGEPPDGELLRLPHAHDRVRRGRRNDGAGVGPVLVLGRGGSLRARRASRVNKERGSRCSLVQVATEMTLMVHV